MESTRVSYAVFLGLGSLGMQLELAWALSLGLEQGSCSNVHSSDSDEVCFQKNQFYPLALGAIFGDWYYIPLGYFFIITISSNFFILKNTLCSSFPNYLFSFRSFDKSESVISSLDKSAKTCCRPIFLYNFDQVPQ